jgi:hypothetical protein
MMLSFQDGAKRQKNRQTRGHHALSFPKSNKIVDLSDSWSQKNTDDRDVIIGLSFPALFRYLFHMAMVTPLCLLAVPNQPAAGAHLGSAISKSPSVSCRDVRASSCPSPAD